jgi:hypothetical protein
MYPIGLDPTDHTEFEHPEAVEGRLVGSSWRTWLIVMLVIATVVLLFALMGDPEASTQTTQVLPNTPTN